MTNDEISTSVTKRPISRKHRVATLNSSSGKNLINEVSMTENSTTTKLPSLLSKSSVFSPTSDTMQLRRQRTQQKDLLTSSLPTRIERQTTNIFSRRRLPTVINDTGQRRKLEFQRKQIYALNHAMRDLEQERFHQFCELNGISTENSEEIILDKTEESTTTELST